MFLLATFTLCSFGFSEQLLKAKKAQVIKILNISLEFWNEVFRIFPTKIYFASKKLFPRK